MSGVSLRYVEHRPRAELVRDLECLWMVWDPVARRSRPPDRVVPDACPEIIVHLADPFRLYVAPRWRRQPRAFLAGTLSRPWLLRAGSRVRTLGMRFRPGTVPAFLAVNMAEVTDREVPLDLLTGARPARELVRALGEATRNSTAFHVAEHWLLERRAERGIRPAGVTHGAVREILKSRGRARIEAVAGRLGISRRRLERALARDLGIRPKLFARIVRLQAAIATLAADERMRAVDWALEAGYFDQSHLSRDFRAMTGRRAGARREDDGELARHFTDPRRLAALLDGE